MNMGFHVYENVSEGYAVTVAAKINMTDGEVRQGFLKKFLRTR